MPTRSCEGLGGGHLIGASWAHIRIMSLWAVRALWTTTGDGCAYPSIVVRDAAEVVLIRPAEGGLIWDLPQFARCVKNRNARGP